MHKLKIVQSEKNLYFDRSEKIFLKFCGILKLTSADDILLHTQDMITFFIL